MKNNYIDEVKKIFETMQEDVANSHHLSDSYLEDLDNVIKQKLQEAEQRKVEEIRKEIIEELDFPYENDNMLNKIKILNLKSLLINNK